MTGYFEGKVAAVTGTASGIGLGLTEHMLARGARAVYMGDMQAENLARESERLNHEYPGRAFPVLADVTELDQVVELISAAKACDGHLDFVFNNAGMRMTPPTEQITFDIWRSIIDLNVMGVVHGTYTAIPIMREQGFGHIVNAASMAGLVPIPYQAVYAASKSEVISMTECLQYELNVEGLRFSVFPKDQFENARVTVADVRLLYSAESEELRSPEADLAEAEALQAAIGAIMVESRRMKPDAFGGQEPATLKQLAEAIVLKGHPKAEILRIHIVSSEWTTERVEEWTDTTKTAWRVRVTRGVTAQAAVKLEGECLLYTIFLHQDTIDGTANPLTGHIMFADRMLEKNLPSAL